MDINKVILENIDICIDTNMFLSKSEILKSEFRQILLFIKKKEIYENIDNDIDKKIRKDVNIYTVIWK